MILPVLQQQKSNQHRGYLGMNVLPKVTLLFNRRKKVGCMLIFSKKNITLAEQIS